jgi:hypothetical protein
MDDTPVAFPRATTVVISEMPEAASNSFSPPLGAAAAEPRFGLTDQGGSESWACNFRLPQGCSDNLAPI